MKKSKFCLKKVNLLFFILIVLFYFNSFFVYAIEKSQKKEEIELSILEEKNTRKIIDKKSSSANDDVISQQEKFDESAVIDVSFSLLENNYKKDSSKKHFFIGWKHDFGSLFSKKIRLFYNVAQVKTVPCVSFQEWLNFKQLCFGLVDHHIPKVNLLFDLIDFSGIKEEFVDDKYDRIALETVDFYRLLKKEPALGCFYFKNNEIKAIDSVNISFCNCKNTGYSLLELIHEIIHFRDNDSDTLKKHLVIYVQHLMEIVRGENTSEEVDLSIEQLLDKITISTDIESLEQNLLFHLIKNLSHKYAPEKFSIHSTLENKKIKPSKEMKMTLSFTPQHQTIGFLLKIKNDAENNFYLYLYEIFNEEKNGPEKLQFIDKVMISSIQKNKEMFFNHLSINVLKKKTLFVKGISLFNTRI
ncbi:MAG: hypothetical protein AB3N34_03145 [Lettuce witches'-broom phytoplasma]